jgi:hypothetical protein
MSLLLYTYQSTDVLQSTGNRTMAWMATLALHPIHFRRLLLILDIPQGLWNEYDELCHGHLVAEP